MDLQSFDWSLLKVFVAVADAGSINAAAILLKFSPAKVSRDIDELEAQVGRELFKRSTRGMELTSAGEIVLRKARSMEEAANSIPVEVVKAKNPKVVIAAHDAMATYWLASRLPEFSQAHPKIEIHIKVVQETPNLADGETDICLQYEPPNQRNTFSRPLGYLHYVPFASRDYLNIHGMPETPFDANRHRILLHSGYNKQMDAWAPDTPHWQAIVSNVLVSNSSTVILEACAKGGGVAVMPSYMAETDRGVVAIPKMEPMASIRFWMAYTERAKTLPQYEPVLEWLRECFDPARYKWFRETYWSPENLPATR